MLTPMPQPFHFAFFVRDLDSTRRFYGEILGCREGRGTESWVDFDFFGNQISAHNTGKPTPTENTGSRGRRSRADASLRRASSLGRISVVSPTGSAPPEHPVRSGARIRYPGQPGEQATMFLLDPSGNALEFKSFKHPEHVFTA